MANRRFEQFQLSLEKKVVTLFMNVTIGASGAPTLTSPSGSNQNKGILSITRVSAGKYTIVFGSNASPSPDTYQRLLSLHRNTLNATASAAPATIVTADNSPSGSVTIQCLNGSSATDPASGEVMLLEIKLSNSGI